MDEWLVFNVVLGRLDAVAECGNDGWLDGRGRKQWSVNSEKLLRFWHASTFWTTSIPESNGELRTVTVLLRLR